MLKNQLAVLPSGVNRALQWESKFQICYQVITYYSQSHSVTSGFKLSATDGDPGPSYKYSTNWREQPM